MLRGMSTATLESTATTPVRTAEGRYAVVDSPLGSVFLGVSDAGVHRVDFIRDGREEAHFASMLALDAGGASERVDPASEPLLAEAARQLGEYFEGTRQVFDLPLAPRGTEFQRAVWDRLLTIPFGATSTYGVIARDLGRPSASRAVGASIGRNPIGVVIPCHRVVGSTGALTGYAGGLDRKRQLLDLEAQALRGT